MGYSSKHKEWNLDAKSFIMMLMQPQPAPMIPNPSDPYHFIMNPEKGSKPQNSLLPNPSSRKGRSLVVVGGLIILLVLFTVVSSLLSSAGQSSTQSLVSLAGRQQELIRVSKLGAASASNKGTQNLAVTTQYAVTSDQASLLALLRRSGIKLTAAQLAAYHNAATDAALTQASQTNQFDDTFNKLLADELTSYQAAIKSAYAANKGATTRSLLNNEYTSAGNLLGAPATQPK